MKPLMIASFVIMLAFGASGLGFNVGFLVLMVGAFMGCLLCTDHLSRVAGSWVMKNVHRLTFKPPANLFALGVILSVVFLAIGFAWDAQVLRIPAIGKSILTLLSIVGHFLCLGAFLGLISSLESAPNFRNSRG